MKEVVDKIVKWHIERNLIDGATDDGQYKKLMSEFGELSDNLAKGRCIKDDLGDMGVVVINIAKRHDVVVSLLKNPLTCVSVSYFNLISELNDIGFTIENESSKHYKSSMEECLICLWEALKGFASCNELDFSDCLEHAYNDIKDRKGKMINGTFVKEADL